MAVLLNGYKYEVSKHLDVLQKIFVVDFTKDVADVHPPYICLKCYACIGHFTLKDVLPTKTVSTWYKHTRECSSCLLRIKKSKGGRPAKRKSPGRSKTTFTIGDMMKLDPRKLIPPKIEEAVANVINMKMKNSSLPNNSIQLNTGGSQPLTLTPISVARKDSDVIAKRTLRARTKQSKDVLQMISGKSEEATADITFSTKL